MLKNLKRTQVYLYIALGMMLGLLYVITDVFILDRMENETTILHLLHEIIDNVIPVVLGACVGYGLWLLSQKRRDHELLFIRKNNLERDLLVSTLLSQILHEIRNPIHNLCAAIEEDKGISTQERNSIIRRNIEKIDKLKRSYVRWTEVSEDIDPRQVTDIARWFEDSFRPKIASEIKDLNIQLQTSLKSYKICAHPIILEQVFLSIFSNAFEILSQTAKANRYLHLNVENSLDTLGCLVNLSNPGQFSEEVLTKQGRLPVDNAKGSGLGLLITQKLLEQVQGQLMLSNEGPDAKVSLKFKRVA